MARLLRVVIFLAPIVVAFLVALWASHALPRADGFWMSVVRWLAIAILSTLVLLGLQRVMKRFTPLAGLLSFTMVFPDAAPQRFGIALRTGTVKQFERRLADIDENGLGDTPEEAARAVLEVVASLSRHDRLTRGHSDRVRAYSRMIGEELGLSDDELNRLQWAGMLHDVGKVAVPSEILNKDGRLTDEEFDIVKTHTTHGQQLVAPLVGWLGESAHAVWEHHERWEGGGYPSGLKASETAQASRIVCVADAFDVMTSARSYKQPMPAGDARAELIRCTGTQFDPAVVRAMLNVSLGKLWATMGPLSLIAQVRLFPRRLTQGGSVVTAALAFLLAGAITGFAAGLPGRHDGPTDDAAAQIEQPVADPAEAGPPDGVDPVAAADPPTDAAADTSTSTTTTTTSSPPSSTFVNRPAPSTSLPSAPTSLPTAPLPPVAPTTTAGPRTTTVATTTPPTGTTTSSTPPTATTVAPSPSTTTTSTSTTVPSTTSTPTTTVPPTTTTSTTTTSTTTTTTSTTTTSTTTTTTTTTLPPVDGELALQSSGGGDTASSDTLRLRESAPSNATLGNYDTDRNADPGLTLTRSADTVLSATSTEKQTWRTGPSFKDVGDPITLQLWFAPATDPGGSPLQVTAALFDCVSNGTACVELVRTTRSVDAQLGTFTPQSFDLSVPGGAYSLVAGRGIELRIGVPLTSATDVWLAYDSVDYPAAITL